MKFLVFDFETTGVGKDRTKQYSPYGKGLEPLPRANYPVEFAASLVNEDGEVVRTERMLIRGATRLDPGVLDNCPHLSVRECDRDGVEFVNILTTMAEMVDGETTLVAHNMQYDWEEVIAFTVNDMMLDSHPDYLKLKGCPRFCTCVNTETKSNKSAYYFKRIGKWIGPSLRDLAKKCSVQYDPSKAHGAVYDVGVTAQCLLQYNIAACQRPMQRGKLGQVECMR